MTGFGDVNHKRLPRSARHLVRSMQKLGTAPQRASVLRTHVAALDYSVQVARKPNERMGVAAGDAEGLRVRLGRETRDLLRRLAASRNYLVQTALVRELRHQVDRRIKQAQRRQSRARAARKRVHGARAVAAGWASQARRGRDKLAARSRSATPLQPALSAVAGRAAPTGPEAVPDRVDRARRSRSSRFRGLPKR